MLRHLRVCALPALGTLKTLQRGTRLSQRPGGSEDTEGVAEPRALALSQLSPLETNPRMRGSGSCVPAGGAPHARPSARPPASHPRQPAARAASAPPGGLLWSRRERALAATEARGSSEIRLPSSPGTSRNPTFPGRKSKSLESAAQRTETTVEAVRPGSEERSCGTKSF